MLNQKENWYLNISSFLLVLLFAYTGLNKLLTQKEFSQQLLQNAFLHPFAIPLSFALPITEIIIAICLVFKYSWMVGIWSAALLMTLFSVYVGFMLFQHKAPLHCTCGGVISSITWRQHLLFNILFSAIAWASLIIHKRKYKNISTNQKEVS
jgi:hypothetical protein